MARHGLRNNLHANPADTFLDIRPEVELELSTRFGDSLLHFVDADVRILLHNYVHGSGYHSPSAFPRTPAIKVQQISNTAARGAASQHMFDLHDN